MTFVFSVHSRDTLWVLADRRLSYGPRYQPKDDAVMVMNLHCADGDGVLAYAGLGATPRGTQPSDWMSAVLRGHGDKTFEQNLRVLADAAKRELPKHLAQIRDPNQRAHFILAAAFVKGIGARLYTIDNIIDPKTGQHWFRFVHHLRSDEPGAPSPRFGAAGSGGLYIFEKYFLKKEGKYFLKKEGKEWQRDLLNLVDAHDRGKVSTHLVADWLAGLNYEVHKALGKDGSVGPRSIVVWRRREGARPTPAASGHQFYTGVNRDLGSDALPNIYNGNDIQALATILLKQQQDWIGSGGFAQGRPFNPDKDELNRLLANISSDPDEKLR